MDIGYTVREETKREREKMRVVKEEVRKYTQRENIKEKRMMARFTSFSHIFNNAPKKINKQ